MGDSLTYLINQIIQDSLAGSNLPTLLSLPITVEDLYIPIEPSIDMNEIYYFLGSMVMEIADNQWQQYEAILSFTFPRKLHGCVVTGLRLLPVLGSVGPEIQLVLARAIRLHQTLE